jgi:sigma-B regulation protein RsbU (phosphoserine phosphatase)
MSQEVVQHIQRGLTEKSQNLVQWLETSPADEKETCLSCATEVEVQTHLHVIEATLQATASDTFGVCQVCQGSIQPGLLEMDYTSTVCLDCLSEPERRELETELALSQTVQRALLPQSAPSIPGLEVAAFSRPAQIVGGDYFDFIPLEDGTHGLTIADAMGHGIAAGMFMTSLQATLRTMLPESSSPGKVLERINKFFLHNVNYTTFVTMFLGIFNPVTQGLTYFNAGHHPVALARRGCGEVTWLQPNGPSIGIIEAYKITPAVIQLDPGDVLIFYTDGVTEAGNSRHEEFGHERLAELALKSFDRSAGEILAALRHELTEFTENLPPVDDITIVVCKVAG